MWRKAFEKESQTSSGVWCIRAEAGAADGGRMLRPMKKNNVDGRSNGIKMVFNDH